jgi:hypothetical protein
MTNAQITKGSRWRKVLSPCGSFTVRVTSVRGDLVHYLVVSYDGVAFCDDCVGRRYNMRRDVFAKYFTPEDKRDD